MVRGSKPSACQKEGLSTGQRGTRTGQPHVEHHVKVSWAEDVAVQLTKELSYGPVVTKCQVADQPLSLEKVRRKTHGMG